MPTERLLDVWLSKAADKSSRIRTKEGLNSEALVALKASLRPVFEAEWPLLTHTAVPNSYNNGLTG